MNWIKNCALICFSLVISFLILEVGSIIIFPISPGPKKIDPNLGTELQINFNKKNSSYIQKFAEYSVNTRIDQFGNRVTPTSDFQSINQLLFLGDSFTFGQGVKDDETIPSLVCKQIKSQCINLGIPGSGLFKQRYRFQNYLKQRSIQIKSKTFESKRLVHLLLASVFSRSSGNDILDTVHEKLLSENKTNNLDFKKEVRVTVKIARFLSINSNAFRVLRTILGSQLRSLAWREDKVTFSEKEIYLFLEQLMLIRNIALQNGFEYIPILLADYSELKNKNYFKTLTILNNKFAFDIKSIKIDGYKPRNLFFPLDGHANVLGNKVFANSIIKNIDD